MDVRRVPRLLSLPLLALFALAASGFAQAQTNEYALKAAFIYNFAVFSEWPAETGNTLTLCVFGGDPFGEELDKLQGRNTGRQTLAVRRVGGLDGLKNCQIVFVAAPAIGSLERVLASLAGLPVLVVADSPGAMRQGAILNMAKTDEGKITFEANLAAARSRGLYLSSKLLRLATEVRQ